MASRRRATAAASPSSGLGALGTPASPLPDLDTDDVKGSGLGASPLVPSQSNHRSRALVRRILWLLVLIASFAIIKRNLAPNHEEQEGRDEEEDDVAFGLGPLGVDHVDEELVEEREHGTSDESWRDAIVQSAEVVAVTKLQGKEEKDAVVASADAALRLAAPTEGNSEPPSDSDEGEPGEEAGGAGESDTAAEQNNAYEQGEKNVAEKSADATDPQEAPASEEEAAAPPVPPRRKAVRPAQARRKAEKRRQKDEDATSDTEGDGEEDSSAAAEEADEGADGEGAAGTANQQPHGCRCSGGTAVDCLREKGEDAKSPGDAALAVACPLQPFFVDMSRRHREVREALERAARTRAEAIIKQHEDAMASTASTDNTDFNATVVGNAGTMSKSERNKRISELAKSLLKKTMFKRAQRHAAQNGNKRGGGSGASMDEVEAAKLVELSESDSESEDDSPNAMALAAAPPAVREHLFGYGVEAGDPRARDAAKLPSKFMAMGMAAATIAGAASRAGRVTPEEVDDIPSASNATKGGMPRQQQRRRKSNPGHLDDVIRAEAGMRGDLVLAKYGFAGAPTMETQEESEAAAWEEHAAAYSIGPLASTLSPCHEAVVTGAGEEDASGETNPPSLAPVPRAKSCRAEEWPLFYDAATHEQFREKADPIRDEDALPRDDDDARNWLPESLRSRGDGNAAEAAAAAAEERMNVDGNKMEVNAARPLKCAVVGNSGVLHSLRLGREIDSHDVVFRINQAPTRTRTENYERDVGSRTDVRILNKRWTAIYGRHHPELTQFDNFNGMYGNTTYIVSRCNNAEFTKFYQGAAKARAAGTHRTLFLTSRVASHFASSISAFRRAMLGVTRHKHRGGNAPSSGYLAVLLALRLCGHDGALTQFARGGGGGGDGGGGSSRRRLHADAAAANPIINIYGMSGEECRSHGCSKAYHYFYNFIDAPWLRAHPSHSFELEGSILRALHDRGIACTRPSPSARCLLRSPGTGAVAGSCKPHATSSTRTCGGGGPFWRISSKGEDGAAGEEEEAQEADDDDAEEKDGSKEMEGTV
ncbi:glycosyltransferase family 29 protein [Pseudoscourfieldia marina]